MVVGEISRLDAALVGRTEELAFVSAALERGGCVIAGAAGVGKSRLASEVAARHRAAVVRVVATAAAGSIPFGAFGHLLAGVASDAGGPIAACIRALRRLSSDVPPTLLLDDAHLLDEASAALVLALRESETVRVLATVRHGERMPDAVTALWKEAWLERLDLQPLSRRELRALVEAHLGAPAAPDVHARVFSLTEGSPLYARELLIDAMRSGALAQHEGRWQWTGRPPEMARLRDLIAARTRDLSDEARLALDLLAVGAPLRLEELAAVAGEEAVAELEAAGLAIVRGLPEAPVIEVAHPMFGEVTLAALPAATARRLRRRLAAAVDRHDLDSFDVLRLALLKLESGASDPELFRRAGAYALRLDAGVPGPGWDGDDPTLAIRLAEAAGPDLEAALLAARGSMALSRFGEVGERLAPFEDAAGRAPFEQAVEYLHTRVYALHWSGRTGDALVLLERAAGWRDEVDWTVARGTLRGWILHDQGRPQTALEAVGTLPQLDGAAPHIRLDALLLLAMVQSRLGLIDRCEALEPQIQRLADELEDGSRQTGWARYLVDGMARSEAARDLGAVAARLVAGRERAEANGNDVLAAALAMVLGRLELTRGHARDAIALLEDAVHGLTAGDPRNALGWAYAHLTRAHALCGDVAAARGALGQAEAIAAERPSHLRLHQELERARAWIEAAEARLPAARERLHRVADAAGEALAAEAEATYDALRFGAPPQPCAQRLAALAARADSDLLDACARHASALAAPDAAAELQAAERFAQLGLDLPAAEAAAVAARAFAAEGRESSVRHASALMTKHAALCQGAITPALIRIPEGARLTPREREIAILAARGRTNAQIGRELVLSVRTVETYVLRACHKLGVDRRTGLAQVLTLDGAPERAASPQAQPADDTFAHDH